MTTDEQRETTGAITVGLPCAFLICLCVLSGCESPSEKRIAKIEQNLDDIAHIAKSQESINADTLVMLKRHTKRLDVLERQPTQVLPSPTEDVPPLPNCSTREIGIEIHDGKVIGTTKPIAMSNADFMKFCQQAAKFHDVPDPPEELLPEPQPEKPCKKGGSK